MTSSLVVPLSLLLFVACGGSGDADGGVPNLDGASDGGDADGGLVLPPPDRPMFGVTAAPLGADGAYSLGITQPAATVEIVFVSAGSPPRLWRLDVSATTPEAVLDLTSPPDSRTPLSAAREADGALHVVWESEARDVIYASDAGGTWTETTIDSGREPSIALHADGTPYVAFAFLGDSRVAHLDGGAWTTDVIAPLGDAQEWTAIADADGQLVLAGTIGDGGVWLRFDEGGTWVERPFDLSEHVFMERSFNYALAAGAAGVLLSYESNQINYAAYLAAGATSPEVAPLGASFEIDLEVTVAAAGAERVYLGGIDGGGERLAVLARGAPEWPLVAAVPWRLSDCSPESVVLGVDASDLPILATRSCDNELLIFRTTGAYPDEYDETCDAAVLALCDEACACGSPEGDACGYTSAQTGQIAANRSGCELSAREGLCSNSTAAFTDLTACIATFDTPEACVTDGYPLPEACASLLDIE